VEELENTYRELYAYKYMKDMKEAKKPKCPAKTRKNVIVEYLDCQIPDTQLRGHEGYGDM